MSGLFKVAFYTIFDTVSLNGAPALSNSVFQRALCFAFRGGMKSSITSVVLQLMNLCMPSVLEKVVCISCVWSIKAAGVLDIVEYIYHWLQMIM